MGLAMFEASSKCNLTNECVSVQIRDFDRDGVELRVELSFGEAGPTVMFKDKENVTGYFTLTPDELKTLCLGLECMVDRVNADKQIGEN